MQIDLRLRSKRKIKKTKTMDKKLLRTIAILPKISSVFSICGSVAILSECFYFERTRLRRVYNRLLCTMAVFDILESVWNFVSTWAIPANNDDSAFTAGNDKICSAQGFFLQLGLTSPILNAFLSWYYLLVIRYCWSEEKIKEKAEPWIYTVSLLIGFGTSITGAARDLYRPSGMWCWIDKEHIISRYVLYFGPLFTCFFVIAFCMGLLVFTVRRLENASKKYLASSYAQKARARNKRDRRKGPMRKLRSTLAPNIARRSHAKEEKSDKKKRVPLGSSKSDLSGAVTDNTKRMEDLRRKLEEVQQRTNNRISMGSSTAAGNDASRILSMRKSRNSSVTFAESTFPGQSAAKPPSYQRSVSDASGVSTTTRNSSSFLSDNAFSFMRQSHAGIKSQPLELNSHGTHDIPKDTKSFDQADDAKSGHEHNPSGSIIVTSNYMVSNGDGGTAGAKSDVSLAPQDETESFISPTRMQSYEEPDDTKVVFRQSPTTAESETGTHDAISNNDKPKWSESRGFVDDVEIEFSQALSQSLNKPDDAKIRTEQSPSCSIDAASNSEIVGGCDHANCDASSGSYSHTDSKVNQTQLNQLEEIDDEKNRLEQNRNSADTDCKESKLTEGSGGDISSSTESKTETSPFLPDFESDHPPWQADRSDKTDFSDKTLLASNKEENGEISSEQKSNPVSEEWRDASKIAFEPGESSSHGTDFLADEPRSFLRRTDHSIGEPSTFRYEPMTNLEIDEINPTNLSTLRKAFRDSKRIGSKTDAKKKKRKTKSRMVTEQALFYVLSFLVTFIWSIINRFYDLSGKKTPHIIVLGNAFFDPLQGFVNFLVYIRPKLISYRVRHPNKTFIQSIRALIMHIEVGRDEDKEAEDGAKKELTRWRKMQLRMSAEPASLRNTQQKREVAGSSSSRQDRLSVASDDDAEIDKMLVAEEEMEDERSVEKP